MYIDEDKDCTLLKSSWIPQGRPGGWQKRRGELLNQALRGEGCSDNQVGEKTQVLTPQNKSDGRNRSNHARPQTNVIIIRGHNQEQPLFLYLPFQAPHDPLQVPKKWVNIQHMPVSQWTFKFVGKLDIFILDVVCCETLSIKVWRAVYGRARQISSNLPGYE